MPISINGLNSATSATQSLANFMQSLTQRREDAIAQGMAGVSSGIQQSNALKRQQDEKDKAEAQRAAFERYVKQLQEQAQRGNGLPQQPPGGELTGLSVKSQPVAQVGPAPLANTFNYTGQQVGSAARLPQSKYAFNATDAQPNPQMPQAGAPQQPAPFDMSGIGVDQLSAIMGNFEAARRQRDTAASTAAAGLATDTRRQGFDVENAATAASTAQGVDLQRQGAATALAKQQQDAAAARAEATARTSAEVKAAQDVTDLEQSRITARTAERKMKMEHRAEQKKASRAYRIEVRQAKLDREKLDQTSPAVKKDIITHETDEDIRKQAAEALVDPKVSPIAKSQIDILSKYYAESLKYQQDPDKLAKYSDLVAKLSDHANKADIEQMVRDGFRINPETLEWEKATKGEVK